jgi:FMN-dependent NADH-azoreductase
VGSSEIAWTWANVMRGVLPLMERFGISTAAEQEADTLAEHLQDELRAAHGIVISPPMIGAWARLPE